jgi:hypothetical protein
MVAEPDQIGLLAGGPGFPYLVRLALACRESEDFLLSDTFLEAIDAYRIRP